MVAQGMTKDEQPGNAVILAVIALALDRDHGCPAWRTPMAI